MYSTYNDTQRCISNDNIIVAQVVVKWKMKTTEYPQKISKDGLRLNPVDNYLNLKNNCAYLQ